MMLLKINKVGDKMRVIAGKYKKKTLQTLNGVTSRPTTDKMKETIFNILGPLSGRGLDLFAGSGGLGIEAISRGMDEMIFVDGSSDAIKVIKANTEYIDEPVEIYRNDAFRALKALKKRTLKLDLILLDPPYNKGLVNKALSAIHDYELLNLGGIIMCECSKNEHINAEQFDVLKHEIYGSIQIMILRGKTNGN